MVFKIINKIFKNNPNILIIQLFVVGITLNLFILLFITMKYVNLKIRDGPRGNVGEPGLKGPEGFPDICQKCEPVTKNLGQVKIDNDKEKSLIVKIPQVPVNQPGRPI